MATFTKFNSFVEHLAEEVHNLGSDQLRVALTNTDPTASADVLATIAADQIDYTNIVENRNVTTSSSAQASGVYSLTLADLVLTASGAVPTFRYVVLYNDTPSSGIIDPLIGYWDYGAGGVTLANGDTFTLDFTGAALTVTAVDGSNFKLFDSFVLGLAHKKHNLASDTLKLMLCNAANAPVATNTYFSDLTPIDYTNLVENRELGSPVTSGQTGGTYTLDLPDYTLTASGGSVAAFRYIAVYNVSSNAFEALQELIGWMDLGSDITLADGESIDITFDAGGVLTLA